MFWRTFLVTFGMILLAELGDKTQLATMLMVTQSERPWVVFAGAACALVVTSLLGVLAGSLLTRHIPTQYLRGGAAVAFILIGLLLLSGRI